MPKLFRVQGMKKGKPKAASFSFALPKSLLHICITKCLSICLRESVYA